MAHEHDQEPTTWAQQQTLGDEFATNRQMGMAMPSYDKGGADPLITVPPVADPNQAQMFGDAPVVEGEVVSVSPPVEATALAVDTPAAKRERIVRQYIESARKSTVYPVPDDKPFYHGTQAEAFDAFESGSSLTQDPAQAAGFAGTGSYFSSGMSQGGAPRVVESRVNLPQGAVFVPASARFGRAVGQAEEAGDVELLQNLRQEYHREAAAEAQRIGHQAYYSDLYEDPQTDLVVLSPESIRIYRQDATRQMREPDLATPVRFADIAERGIVAAPEPAPVMGEWVNRPTKYGDFFARKMADGGEQTVSLNPFGDWVVSTTIPAAEGSMALPETVHQKVGDRAAAFALVDAPPEVLVAEDSPPAQQESVPSSAILDQPTEIPAGPAMRPVAATGAGKEPRETWDDAVEDCMPLDHAVLCRMNPDALQTDAVSFQYKQGADEAGVLGTLASARTWDPDLGGVVHVWQQSDGQMFVTDGHQRLEFAKRAKAEGQDVYLLAKIWREVDSPDMSREEQKREMRLRSAKKNIAEGSGTAVDAARVLREEPSLLDTISRDNALARDGLGLSRLSDSAFQEAASAVNSGRIDARVAAMVSGNARSEELQRGLLGALIAGHQKGDGLTLGQGAEIIYAYKEAAGESPGDSKLQASFLDDVVQESAWEERDALKRGLVRSFQRDQALFGSVVRGEGRLESVGNELDDAANRTELDQAQQHIAYFNTLAHAEGPLATYLTQKAKGLKTSRDQTGQPLSKLIGPAVLTASKELRPYLKDYDKGGSGRLSAELGLDAAAPHAEPDPHPDPAPVPAVPWAPDHPSVPTRVEPDGPDDPEWAIPASTPEPEPELVPVGEKSTELAEAERYRAVAEQAERDGDWAAASKYAGIASSWYRNAHMTKESAEWEARSSLVMSRGHADQAAKRGDLEDAARRYAEAAQTYEHVGDRDTADLMRRKEADVEELERNAKHHLGVETLSPKQARSYRAAWKKAERGIAKLPEDQRSGVTPVLALTMTKQLDAAGLPYPDRKIQMGVEWAANKVGRMAATKAQERAEKEAEEPEAQGVAKHPAPKDSPPSPAAEGPKPKPQRTRKPKPETQDAVVQDTDGFITSGALSPGDVVDAEGERGKEKGADWGDFITSSSDPSPDAGDGALVTVEPEDTAKAEATAEEMAAFITSGALEPGDLLEAAPAAKKRSLKKATPTPTAPAKAKSQVSFLPSDIAARERGLRKSTGPKLVKPKPTVPGSPAKPKARKSARPGGMNPPRLPGRRR